MPEERTIERGIYTPWVNFALGIAVIITPFVSQSVSTGEMASDVIVGIVLAVIALVDLFSAARAEWINVLAGIWLWISAAFSSSSMLHWQHVVYGCLAIVTAIAALAEFNRALNKPLAHALGR
ncbi:MAG TPA: SPW repeat protein [Candidatus Xenobia bacterium]|jgi:hypothetical protein